MNFLGFPILLAGVLALFGLRSLFASDPLSPVSALKNGRLEVGLFALGAAVLWASGTVLGRFALGSISFWSMTALRFTLAFPVLVMVVLVQIGGAAARQFQNCSCNPTCSSGAVGMTCFQSTVTIHTEGKAVVREGSRRNTGSPA